MLNTMNSKDVGAYIEGAAWGAQPLLVELRVSVKATVPTAELVHTLTTKARLNETQKD
ncbi:MAG TPA: hypothetical protein VIM37_03770 [Candidatus Microsaccharimonas sp.]